MRIGVSIPAYRNVESLRRCLDSVATYLPDTNLIVVVDDSGSGAVGNSLRAWYPRVDWILHQENRGFGASATEAVLANRAEIVILINDDVELLVNPKIEVSAAFADPDLFAVTFRSVDGEGRFREGAKRLIWRMGLPRVLHNERDQRPALNGIHPTSYAVGGHAAFHREKFAALGGFDPLFHPFYWEDVDLCQRASQRGWDCRYLPECVVRHADHGAIRTAHNSDYIREITLRNRLLFAWRHVPAPQRSFLNVTLAWEQAIGWLRHDDTWIRAIRSAKERRHLDGSLDLQSAATATNRATVER